MGYRKLNTDGTLAGNSDSITSSQKAHKTYADTKIPKTLIDAKGDIVVGSAADTPAILTVGADGKSIFADSAASSGLRYDFNYITDRGSLPTGAIAHNISRGNVFSGQSIMGTSGAVGMYLIGLNKGQTVASATFISGGTGITQGATTNHLWAALCDTSGVVLAVTADDTNPVWASNSIHTFTFADSYLVPTSGYYYVAICFAWTGGGGVGPTLAGCTYTLTTVGGLSVIYSCAGPTGQTTPPSVSSTLTPGAVKGGVPYFYAS